MKNEKEIRDEIEKLLFQLVAKNGLKQDEVDWLRGRIVGLKWVLKEF